ncbi:cytochrome o ubiquinol oxidase subunit IV [Parasaccharibacter sp. TMW2.1882]|uniref:Cytochrome bo(3) ubiquinol oxidase subunit 4 n=2 Tax=Acetobacteraceae TaxID=433 RepID=A0A7U7G6L1_9PROT|nr:MULTISPECIES: cytochrome o ubiquinol oxidase subunit IV [Acetobacteraceae]MCL1561973.1 cytochrome o ubiquinol oxidase subunit IV [Parasaccharibacter sp. TMW 2.1886]MCQ0042027.1 cytochrome o ubiquinol oxidase subunit IV [Bombella sp.]MUG79245.1 cytochrome o ubiquinol oxidase subunit IV [Bombella sp. ESL0380]MUH02564.1 cytochrome o ubiquinol oxidase subunit IV [Bombella sp. ESL0387]QGT74934.1 cytochrome o ubiquinol oxidase subunit IV [Bombella sp. ESL0368]
MSGNHTTSHEGENHGSYGSYIVGFILAVVLTVASFATVLSKAFSFWQTIAILGVLAAVQMVVHLIFFLHMGTKSLSQRQNLAAFIVTALMVLIVVAGYLFVLWDAQANMMAG